MKVKIGNPLIMGATKTETGHNFAIQSTAKSISLRLYKSISDKEELNIELDETYKIGNIFSVMIEDIELNDYYYNYIMNGKSVVDPYAKTISGCHEFGKFNEKNMHVSKVELEQFEWGNDRSPKISYSECIVYKLHVRGFTKSKTSEVHKKGTFAGIMEKIPYIKELGITTIELMPAYEFEEIQKFEDEKPNNKYTVDMKKPLNYWGYTGGLHFAPKSSYCASDSSDYTIEFKTMVRELHKNGIEVIMEMFFDTTDARLIGDCVRYWVMEYHIDGVHLYCEDTALNVVATDPLLAQIKIFTINWNGKENQDDFKNMGNYNDSFSVVAKKFLKGDEDQLSAYLNAIRSNPSQSTNINYITNHNGFTMYDLVSYDRKHNEANGEDNRDGENYNHSWNCGVEGKTRRKKILDLRQRQVKNAFLLLLLGQSTPLILAGDEFENSQSGNNNPYCIDSETTWINWDDSESAKQMLAFVKSIIMFRKNHKILHMPTQLSASDRLSCGYPDVSYHGSNAWYTGLANYDRYVGVMYCSKYAEDTNQDELIYVAYNMHWERHELALPQVAEGCNWKSVVNSAGQDECAIIEDNRMIKIEPRSIAVLVGVVKKSTAQKSTAQTSKKTKETKETRETRENIVSGVRKKNE